LPGALAAAASLHAQNHSPNVFVSGVVGCVVFGRRACRRFPSQARLWFWAVVVAVPALASFVLDDLSDEQQPLFRHWHSVWHVLALVSTAYAMAFVLAVQLVQVRRCGGWKMGECVCDA